ncbi:nucleoside:proton symporter [filamentous cyanobacterium LEGE 11480]|uniref:Nucleoside:proton symporter n=1 Tax=Romeriopsis navalis LEGE 11480 TaxID=2777977 RepID=A0A928VQ48_9CYAN|nr:nucleoside transporter C-terminal domain-containing protein [Romeriopsis navalis]MBE9030074.1 nucleoside:proton symporter [Romeriopsis navalis LEGE 11480]
MSWLNLVSFFGIFALCLIAWVGSENRKQVPWKVILWGIGLQLIFGLVVFQFPLSRRIIELISKNINAIINATEAGARFLFGNLIVPDPINAPGPVGAGRWIARAITPGYVPVPGDRLAPENISLGYILAFRALPLVVFFSSLMSLLYHWHVIQPIINFFGKIFRWTMGLSGAEALSGAANIFVGIESGLVIRPFLEKMTRSELCSILSACYGSIASTVLAIYALFLAPTFPTIAGHLVSASLMSIPACFVLSKILVPETEVPVTLGGMPTAEADEAEPENAMESIIQGAMDGAKLAIAIAALLIAILGLVALVDLFFGNLAGLAQSPNAVLKQIGQFFQVVNVKNILGALFVPLVSLTGISNQWTEIWQSSVLIGSRLVETEIPAYLSLASLAQKGAISDRALVIISYILCGFAHLPSYGIFVGGFSSLIPSRRKDITELGWKALWAATLATIMTGCIAGVFFSGNASILGRG